LLVSGNPLAKTQYLDSQRMQLNNLRKENIRLVEEAQKNKRKADTFQTG
jgi:hypothetical protein